MTPSLERLAEMVRQAEAKTRAKRLEAEIQEAAELFRNAEIRARQAEQRSREVRPARLRELDQVDADEQHLKELVRKLAQYKSSLESDTNPEDLIDTAQEEIERKRREARAELEAISKENEEARQELRIAMEKYKELRQELDRLQPHLVEAYCAEDRLLREAETHFPGGQIQSLAREIEASINYFGVLTKREQYAQLKIWIGRYRHYQATIDEDVPEDIQVLAQRVFHQLKGISKQYEPGYIEAFRHDFTTDWISYIADAEDQFQLAAEEGRRSRNWEAQRIEQQARDQERKQEARESGHSALEELKALITRFNLPQEGVDEFLAVLKQAVNGLGASDPELLEVIMPYRELITGGNGLRAVRRNLDRARDSEKDEDAIFQEEFGDLTSATQGLRALMIGGSVREDVRRSLQKVFGFDRLEWIPYEDSKPVMLDSLEQRVRHRSVDLVLILKSFIAHHVPERLRPLCEQNNIPCLMVERGYGAAQIGETIRRGLLKTSA